MLKIKKTLSAKYHKPGQEIGLDTRYAKFILMQEEGECEVFGVPRRFTTCMIIDKTQEEIAAEEKKNGTPAV